MLDNTFEEIASRLADRRMRMLEAFIRHNGGSTHMHFLRFYRDPLNAWGCETVSIVPVDDRDAVDAMDNDTIKSRYPTMTVDIVGTLSEWANKPLPNL